MWGFASKSIGGASEPSNSARANQDSSDDEISVNDSRDEGLECPICLEFFNIVENVPYVLWCGHTLCKNCVLGLESPILKLPNLPVQLPFFISCPWCNWLSFRLVYNGNLKFPHKNYFLLWMIININDERYKSCDHLAVNHDSRFVGQSIHDSNDSNRNAESQFVGQSQSIHDSSDANRNAERLCLSLHKSLILFVKLTAKLPLVIIFLLIVIYAIPASIAILLVYILITILIVIPAFLVLYFAYPSLDWLVREIVA